MPRRGFIGVCGFLLLICLALVARSSERWLLVQSEHLWVGVRSDLPENFLQGRDTLDAFRDRLLVTAEQLDQDFQRVERALRTEYAVERYGRVPVLLYPDLDAYQQDAECLICAAHVGPLLAELPDVQETLDFGAHLNLDSTESTILHEFTHVVDFAMIDHQIFPVWYEGLASYIGDGLQGGKGRALLNLLPQYLKLYQQLHPLQLQDYLTFPAYGRWTYNLGTQLIDMLVQRAGMDTFMAFYRALDRPDSQAYDALLGRFYGVGLDQLQREWQAQLDRTAITEEGQRAFRFKMDQVVVRWTYLRPLLRDPQRLSQAYFNLWREGRFNAEEARFMREYLQDFQNMLATPDAVEAVLQNVPQLRSYVLTYAQSPLKQNELIHALEGLQSACSGSAEPCALAYFNIIHAFIRWE